MYVMSHSRMGENQHVTLSGDWSLQKIESLCKLLANINKCTCYFSIRGTSMHGAYEPEPEPPTATVKRYRQKYGKYDLSCDNHSQLTTAINYLRQCKVEISEFMPREPSRPSPEKSLSETPVDKMQAATKEAAANIDAAIENMILQTNNHPTGLIASRETIGVLRNFENLQTEAMLYGIPPLTPAKKEQLRQEWRDIYEGLPPRMIPESNPGNDHQGLWNPTPETINPENRLWSPSDAKPATSTTESTDNSGSANAEPPLSPETYSTGEK